MAAPSISSGLRLSVDGAPFPEDSLQLLADGFVDDNLHLPDMFLLRFRDPDRLLLSRCGVRIGSTIVVTALAADSGTAVPLMTGEVTALEAEIDGSGTFTVIRGFDAGHRLLRGTRTAGYRQVTYADIARTVASRNGIAVDRIDPTPTVHETVTQANCSDWDFLRGLAAEVGYDVIVEKGKLSFCAPTEAASQSAGDSSHSHVLELGADLRRLRVSVTAGGQVPEVEVRGWDDQTQRAVVARRPAETAGARIGVQPADLARQFSAPTLVTPHPSHHLQSSVDQAATALADRLAGTFAELEGVARGNAALQAGHAVTIANLGTPFDGSYVLTRARHVFRADAGYSTEITVSGKQQRSLLGLVTGAMGASSNGGLATAVVDDVRDPEQLGRVRLRLPWLDDTFTTPWARVAQSGAGPDRGAVVVPESGDEVLVGFAHGDLSRPFVIGGLYSMTRKATPGAVPDIDSGTGEVTRRAFVSRTGHRLEFLDGKDPAGIRMRSAGDKLVVSLDAAATTLTLHSDGRVQVSASSGVSIDAGSGGVTVDGGQRIELRAKAGLTLDGGSGDVVVKGSKVDVSGTTETTISAPNVALAGQSQCSIQAPMVRIN
ncbi:VgrG-related protein [Kribbella sp. NBC_01505]|uniref:VgrG-related protein n=1 Tax=Kribbella sp. NBC_01505 TaxID=2903580 RepID=UPI0038677EE3